MAHEIWGEGKKSQRCIMFHISVTGGLISLKTYIDIRRRMDFRGKIINLILDMLTLRGNSFIKKFRNSELELERRMKPKLEIWGPLSGDVS